MANKIRMATAAAALVPLALLAACGSSGGASSGSGSSPSASASSSSGGVAITETGSTLVFPLFGAWQTAYNTDVTDVTITGAGTGSGTGIADAATGTVTMGASDAYLSPADIQQYPGLINIPLTVASVMVNYNVPGVSAKKPLNFNGTVLSQIYSGKVKTWNDPAIKKLNPGVSLPALKITTLHRADSSGSTFLFTSYLNAQDPGDWPATAVGTTVSWPSGAAAQAETGSGGMVTGCGSIKGCIAYIGISYLSKSQAANLGEASLANKAGKFTQPTTGAVKAALASFGTTPASGSQSLINTSDPKGYPIVNFEYAVVKKQQPSAQIANALKAFLKWCITTGEDSKYLDAVGFEPLPSGAQRVAQNLISSISS